jgi:ParB-like chromosome segregation protein Spo0J
MAKHSKPPKLANIEPVITDEVRKVASLTVDPRNAKKHPEAQIAQLVTLIERFGYIEKLVIRPNGQLVGGEGRLEAIKRIGWDRDRMPSGRRPLRVRLRRARPGAQSHRGKWPMGR